jgi:hypothetical protein
MEKEPYRVAGGRGAGLRRQFASTVIQEGLAADPVPYPAARCGHPLGLYLSKPCGRPPPRQGIGRAREARHAQGGPLRGEVAVAGRRAAADAEPMPDV